MIKKGLKVRVLTGKDKKKEGEVIEIDRPNNRAKVKEINMVKFYHFRAHLKRCHYYKLFLYFSVHHFQLRKRYNLNYLLLSKELKKDFS